MVAKYKKIILFFFGIILFGLFIFKKQDKQEKEKPIVHIEKATCETVPLVLSLTSILEADEVSLKPRTKGKLIKISVEEGQIVEEDAILFKMDDAELLTQKKQQEAMLRKSEAQLSLAQKQLEKSTALLAKGVHTQDQWDTFQMTVKSLKADNDLLKAKIEEIDLSIKDTVIKSPFFGRIGFINVQEGDYLDLSSSSSTLATVQKICQLESTLSIPEKYVRNVLTLPTDSFDIEIFDINDNHLCHALKQVILDQKINQSTGTLGLKIFIDNKKMDFRPGMTIQSKIKLGTYNSNATLPAKAIIQTEKGACVYLYNNKEENVSLMPIDVESILDDKALIKTEIKENQYFVIDGQIHLKDKMKVSVQK